MGPVPVTAWNRVAFVLAVGAALAIPFTVFAQSGTGAESGSASVAAAGDTTRAAGVDSLAPGTAGSLEPAEPADHVAEVPDRIDGPCVGEDRLQGRQVGVDVRQDRDPHGEASLAGGLTRVGGGVRASSRGPRRDPQEPECAPPASSFVAARASV